MTKIILLSTLLIFIVSSCQKSKNAGDTPAVKAANEWWATRDSSFFSNYFGADHIRIATCNASANNNKICVDECKNGDTFKIRTAVDYEALTLSSADSAASEYFVTVSSSLHKTAQHN